jgi:uncharacterized protein YajQ (UPF0234 family)
MKTKYVSASFATVGAVNSKDIDSALKTAVREIETKFPVPNDTTKAKVLLVTLQEVDKTRQTAKSKK